MTILSCINNIVLRTNNIVLTPQPPPPEVYEGCPHPVTTPNPNSRGAATAVWSRRNSCSYTCLNGYTPRPRKSRIANTGCAPGFAGTTTQQGRQNPNSTGAAATIWGVRSSRSCTCWNGRTPKPLKPRIEDTGWVPGFAGAGTAEQQ